MMKTKWRCGICEKLLASKQTALKHLALVHKTDDHSVGVAKVQVQETNNENKVTKENQGSTTAKNKAYGFFAPLTNIFNDENMVEGFSWGDKTKKSDQNDNFVASSSSNVESDLDISETIVDAADSDLATTENVFSNKKSTTTRPTFVPPILPVFHPPRNILDQTISDFPDISYLQSFEIDPTLDRTVEAHSNNSSSPPEQLTEVSPHSDSVSDSNTLSYNTVPLKTRGHCGREDCVGCNREPCGVCFNCLNKRKIR